MATRDSTFASRLNHVFSPLIVEKGENLLLVSQHSLAITEDENNLSLSDLVSVLNVIKALFSEPKMLRINY